MRSDLMKEGASRAPHRSLLKALGITDREMKRPFVAVVSSKSDYIPGHAHLDTITKAVEAGIRNAGGVPFNTIGVCDGLSMNHKGMKYSLCSRELIADSIEVMLTAHPMDAVVFIPNCDKVVPGMLMAACRMNLPSIFVSGGPMMPGRNGDKRMGLNELFCYGISQWRRWAAMPPARSTIRSCAIWKRLPVRAAVPARGCIPLIP